MLAGSGVELLDTAAEIAFTHHERFDGAGYPRGLAGEEIFLPGRITAVADAFDALTTDRVYRAAVSVEQAVETLKAERERHFDPRVVDAFLEGLDEAIEIHARFPSRGAAGDRARGQADHAAGRRRDARDLPQPAAPLGRRRPDPHRPHRGRAPSLLARGRPPARRRERRAPDRAPGRAARRAAAGAGREPARPRTPAGRGGGRRDLSRRPAGLVRVRTRGRGARAVDARARSQLRERPLHPRDRRHRRA